VSSHGYTWRVAGPILWAIARAVADLVKGVRKITPLHPTGGRYQLPADFLVKKEGKILAIKYGKGTADQ